MHVVFFVIFATNSNIMYREEVVKDISEAVKSLPYDIEVRLYGSVARGEARENSDIDLLILVNSPKVTPEDEMKIFTPIYDIELNSGVIINPIIIPKNLWGKTITPFYENVMNDS